jgi:hypothetical protein
VVSTWGKLRSSRKRVEAAAKVRPEVTVAVARGNVGTDKNGPDLGPAPALRNLAPLRAVWGLPLVLRRSGGFGSTQGVDHSASSSP